MKNVISIYGHLGCQAISTHPWPAGMDFLEETRAEVQHLLRAVSFVGRVLHRREQPPTIHLTCFLLQLLLNWAGLMWTKNWSLVQFLEQFRPNNHWNLGEIHFQEDLPASSKLQRLGALQGVCDAALAHLLQPASPPLSTERGKLI